MAVESLWNSRYCCIKPWHTMLITYIQREYLSALVESCTVITKLPMICVNMLVWPCNSAIPTHQHIFGVILLAWFLDPRLQTYKTVSTVHLQMNPWVILQHQGHACVTIKGLNICRHRSRLQTNALASSIIHTVWPYMLCSNVSMLYVCYVIVCRM